jgi:hypothetical protein
MATAAVALAQSVSTTTVQGTVYLANGTPGSGTLQLSWPAFNTASSQTVAAGKIGLTIGADGFVSVNLAPNLGSSPAGLYYTAIYHMSDGTTSTEYWVVPAAAQASLAQVRSQVMPAAQAVQAVTKAYVDQAIQSVAQGNLTSTGGQLTGPLYLTGDPTQSLQAADKHYVDSSFSQAVPLSGGTVNGPLTAQQLGAAFQVDQFSGGDFGAKLQACLAAINSSFGGTCDARNFGGTLAMGANLTVSTANTTVMLPCATITTANQILVTAGTRNVSLRGCALRGASNASGSQGGTVLLYSGAAAAIQVGDRSYASDTLGFHLDNVVLNITAATSANAQAFAAYRTQEIDLESLYLLGNANQTGITLDGTGNYTGGTLFDNHISGFQTAINGIGHQVTNSAATDWLNASTFVRLHIDCPTASGNPIAGTYGVNLQQGDGNTFTGGDVENCGTAVHLGANAQNNTIVGLRNENSTNQVVADPGSSYNSWMTGGTMFTGKLTDNGTRNSFLDAFHRSFNSLNGDWYGSQQDATLTNHYRLGIGSGNERGLLDRYQTDYGYRWSMGLSDATGGEQFYQVLDELNSVYRLSIGQYNNGQGSTNNQTVINSAGSGAVVLNGSNNAGTGGVVFGSGGANETTVATVSNTGNAQFNGTLQVGGAAQSAGTMTVRNNADSEVDYYLWPGLTSSQKGSFTYKDWNGNSQWYMLKDASNNWALNSAAGGLDSFKAYQSTNSGDTYINASNTSGVVRVNYETGAGSAFNIYGGNSSSLYASFSGNTSIKFPGLSASSGHNCLQIDASGYITNTGSACSAGGGSGTVNSGATGQIAYYNTSGTAVSGMSTIPVSAGGTGASTAIGALAALGGVSMSTTAAQTLAGPISASVNSQLNVIAYGAKGDCSTDDHNAIVAAQTAAQTYAVGSNAPAAIYFPKPPGGCYLTSTVQWTGVSLIGQPAGIGIGSPTTAGVVIKGKPGQDVLHVPDPTTSTYTWNPTWTIRDITFMEDTTAAGSFPHRWLGRWFDDAGMTAGGAVLTTNAASVGCSDIGQAVQVNGAGASGANLVTTIANVDPCWANVGSSGGWKVITLAATAATTVTNAHAYISVLGLPVTATVGACAIAMDDVDANPAHWVNPAQPVGSMYSTMENVSFIGFNGPANNACGLYVQGAQGLYGLNVTHSHAQYQTFGVVQGASELNSFYTSNAGDFETWKNILFNMDVNPWISYNGGEMRWEDVELTVQSGPQFLSLGNQWADLPMADTLNIAEFETWGTPSTYGLRITGLGFQVNGTEIAPAGMVGYLDVSGLNCNGCFTGGTGTASYLYGYGNTVTGMTLGDQIIDKGRGNTVTGIYSPSYIDGLPVDAQYSFTPMKNDNTLNSYSPNFLDAGYAATPYKNGDLWMWPKDFIVGYTTTTPWSYWYQDDPDSLTGGEFFMPSGGNFTQWYQFPASNAYNMTVGSQIPAGPGTFYFRGLCPTGVTTEDIGVTTTGGYSLAGTQSCSTTLQNYALSYNLTAQTGSVGIKNFLGTGFWLAWAYFAPAPALPAGTTIGGVAPSSELGPTSGTAAGELPCFTNTSGAFNVCNAAAAYAANITAATGFTLHVKSTQNTAAGTAVLEADKGNVGASAVLRLADTGLTQFDVGLITSDAFNIHDLINGHYIFSLPVNTMPTNSIGGNSNGATAITQPAADNSTNIATDAFVKSNLPLAGTTGSIGGSALAAGGCASGTVNVTGATTGMAVVATPVVYPGDGMAWRPYVSSAGVITVKVCADVAGTPTASAYNVRVIP